jgi:hypothetical protein
VSGTPFQEETQAGCQPELRDRAQKKKLTLFLAVKYETASS